MRNFKRLISFILVVALALPAAVFAEQPVVAENVQTGVTYTNLQTALSSAAKGQTVRLLADTQLDDVFVGGAKTLDLNGCTLTAGMISVSFTTSHIIDSKNGQGLLVITSGYYAFNDHNKQLPIWTSEGVRFIEAGIKDMTQMLDANTMRYKFYLTMHSDDTILDKVLENGSDGTGITIRVSVKCTYANGLISKQDFVLSNDKVKEYVSRWDASMVILSLAGVEGKAKVECLAEVVSTAPDGTSVVISV